MEAINLELNEIGRLHIFIGLIGFISGALSVTSVWRLPARVVACTSWRCGFRRCAQPGPPPGVGKVEFADSGTEPSTEELRRLRGPEPVKGARRVHYSEDSEPFRVDCLVPAGDSMAKRLQDLTVLPQVIYCSGGSSDSR